MSTPENFAAEDDPGISIKAVQRLKLGPGDVLVLHLDRIINYEAAARIRHHVESFFPGNKCMVLEPGARLEVVTQEGVA